MKRHFITFAIALTITVISGSSAFAQVLTPQGRLTLQSNTPVMTSDVANTSTIYYTPYTGNMVPLSSTTSFTNFTFSQLTLTLDSTHFLAGEIHDVYVSCCGTGSTPVICAGPAWASSTSRGTSTAPAAITFWNGFWVNTNTVTDCYNNGSADAFVANDGTYLGSIYITSNGETSMQFKPGGAAGGSNNVLGVWNAYNRVRATSQNFDSNSSWTYNSTTLRPADGNAGNTNNRITYIDGLEQSRVEAQYQCYIVAPAGENIVVSVGWDWLTGNSATGVWGIVSAGLSGSTYAKDDFLGYGVHYVQALEQLGNGSTAATFQGGVIQQMLSVSLEM